MEKGIYRKWNKKLLSLTLFAALTITGCSLKKENLFKIPDYNSQKIYVYLLPKDSEFDVTLMDDSIKRSVSESQAERELNKLLFIYQCKPSFENQKKLEGRIEKFQNMGFHIEVVTTPKMSHTPLQEI